MLREAPLKFTRELSSALVIQSVSPGAITVSGETYSETIALSPDTVLTGWPAKPIGELVHDDFAAVLDDSPEMLLLGTGSRHVFPPRELMFAFARCGIGLEVMDTAAAARTFNVLASEGRKVAAVLYL